MISYKNKPVDLKLRYRANDYEKIEKLFDNRDGELPLFMFMLALLGFRRQMRVSLDTVEGSTDHSHDFSLRTIYPRNEADFDAYIGFIAILDNVNLTYDEVINQIAFERTEMNETPFLKMTNVKTFFEYMFGGIRSFCDQFFMYGTKPVDVADAIHEYLTDDHSIILDVMETMLLEEEEE